MQLLPPNLTRILAICALVAIASAADAQTVTVNRCAATKVRCVMGYTHVCGVQGVLGLFKCHQTATLKSRFIDQVCANRCEDKMLECFRDAERLGGCLTTGDVGPIQAKVEAFVTDAVSDLIPGFPFPVTNTCAANKQKAVAEATAAKLECFEDPMRRFPGVVAPNCLVGADAKFTYAWDKIEGNGGCLTTGDDAALRAKLDAFVADVIADLNP